MRKIKIIFGISVAALAGSLFFAYEKIGGDISARQLHEAASEVAELVEKEQLTGTDEYREYINQCNQAMKKKSRFRCAALIHESEKVKKQVEEDVDNLKQGAEKEERYQGLMAALKEMPETGDLADSLENQLLEMEEILSARDGRKSGELLAEIGRIEEQLDERLKPEASETLKQLETAEAAKNSMSEAVRDIYDRWSKEAETAGDRKDSVLACIQGNKALALEQYEKDGNLCYPPILGAEFDGNTGKIRVALSDYVGEMSGKTDGLYVLEMDETGRIKETGVKDIYRIEMDKTLGVHVVGSENSGDRISSYMSSTAIPSEPMKGMSKEDRFNYIIMNHILSNAYEDPEALDIGWYDVLYQAAEKAGDTAEDNVILAYLDSLEMGTSIHTPDDIVRMAHKNGCSFFILYNNQDQETDRVIEEMAIATGGVAFKYRESEIQTSDIDRHSYRFLGEYYEIEYETDFDGTEAREIYLILTKGEYVFCTKYSYSPGQRKEKTQEPAVQQESETDFIFPDSSERYLEEGELEVLDPWELKIARNEIYARHGRMFNSVELVEYFGGKNWYVPSVTPENFTDDMLNEYERYNTRLIAGYEGT